MSWTGLAVGMDQETWAPALPEKSNDKLRESLPSEVVTEALGHVRPSKGSRTSGLRCR